MGRYIATISFAFLVSSIASFSQQANNWYFGNHAGLSFATSPPTALANSQINTNEGCASISDNNGQLLFYTDGVTVWNRNHQPMPNGTGLMGSGTSTHSAIVIPKPGNSNLYYLFTSDHFNNNGAIGFRYSEVDMTLNGGLGDINAVKNVLLYAPGTEKITAASHANGIDVWIITKEWNNHLFRSYKVTCNGIDPVPVISAVDPKNGSTVGYMAGCIKVSPDGTKIASARNYEGKWDLFKFDNSTGVVSDRIMFSQSAIISSYGVEFSPDSRLLYTNGIHTTQYKVDVYDSATIFDSRYALTSGPPIFVGALQLGPDGKIYSATTPNLSVINNPNQQGVGCNFVPQAISVSPGQVLSGLPTFFNRLVTNYNLDFTYTVQANCASVDFSGITNIPGPISWHWDFGDGQTATGQNVNHVFPASPNQFTVTLTVTNSNVCGGNAVRSKVLTFDRIVPDADFNATTICDSRIANFQNTSTILPPGSINNYHWDFGDGNFSTQQNPIHTYNTWGTYTVTLTTTSADACQSQSTETKTVVIAPKPTISFSARDTCFTEAVTFQNNSSISYGSISTWAWNFGDGNTSLLQQPAHTYTSPGTYTVNLTATSNHNCVSGPFPLTVIAGAKPQVGFQVPSICLLDATANFTNNTTISDGSTLNYNWNFNDPNATAGNPNTSTLQHPSHIYSQAANYNVKLVAGTSLGCKDSLTRLFTVNGAVPRANFVLQNTGPLCVSQDVEIQDSSYVDFGNITKVEINWGDGNITTDNNPGQLPNGHIYTHRYASFSTPATRNYTVTMQSWSGGVCTHILTRVITLQASPEIQFNPIPEICNELLPVAITQASVLWGLSGSGLYSGAGITNGATGMFNPQLLTPGTYPIIYSYTSTAGCRTDSVRNLTINPTPVADFNFGHGCLPDALVQFNTQSSVAGGNANTLQHNWNFGDPLAGAGNPNTSILMSPSHIYHSLDSFAVSLQVTSVKGCRDDTVIKVYPGVSIFNQPVANFRIDSSFSICAGSPVYFLNNSNGAGRPLISYHWAFADGGTASISTPSHIYAQHGTYDVTLWVENDKGCRSAVTHLPVTVHSIPVADFVFDSTCYGKPVQFFDRSANALGTPAVWNWNLGNGNVSNQQNPVATYTAYQPFTVTMQTATPNGCVSAPVNKRFTIERVNVYAGRDTVIARGQPLQLQASGAASYNWSPATGLSNAFIANPIAVLNTNPQLYYLKGITTTGCIGFDTILIKVFDKADIYVPTGFTPNGDGLNDYLSPICIGIKQFNFFRIYDRWGNIIFSSRNQYDRWDGLHQGAKLNGGNFIWMAEAITFDGRLLQRKGSFVLIR